MNMEIFRNSEFGSIRVIEEDGKYLFCGSDVAKALGYSNPRKAVRDHARGGTKRSIPTASGDQTMTFLPEGDVYRLIVHSRLPGAERFEKWVFDEVLPTIRRTGGYMTPCWRRRPGTRRSFSPLRTSSWRSMRRTAALPGRWNGCGRKQISMTPLSMKKTAPISGLRRRNCKSGNVRFAVS